MALKIKLKPHEKIIVNGAVLAAGERPTEMVFLNRARILRDDDVMVEEQIRQAMEDEGGYKNDSWFYYLIQLIYIDPENSANIQKQLSDTVLLLCEEFPEKTDDINKILGLMADGHLFKALKSCQKVFPDCLSPRINAKKNCKITKVDEPMSQKLSSYEKPPAANDPREIESWALMKSAERMDNARRDAENDDELRESLRINQVLWTIIQTAVAGVETELPSDVRNNILNLSIIVDRQTFARLSDMDRDKLSFLIDLNRNLALGLMGMPGEGDAMNPLGQA